MKDSKLKGFKFVLHKAYLDQGMGLTSPVKYLIALFGISSLNAGLTLAVGVFWIIVSYLVGWFWFNKGFKESEIEVQNRFNLFVKEMRERKSI